MKYRTGIGAEPKKVLYAGSLPVFTGVGSHPQFHNLKKSPPGYDFVFDSSI